MRIIPAIDLINGKIVRLTKGDYSTEKIYYHDPLDYAKEIADHGFRYLHLVDLDGAKASKIINDKVLYQIAVKTNLIIDFGGGIKTIEDLKIAFENGATQVTVGSVALQNPEIFLEWIRLFGTEKFILGADVLDRKIRTNAWKLGSDTDIIDFINFYKSRGIKNVLCTDISKDGMLTGTSNELYKEIIETTQVNLIASGGVSSLADIEALKIIQCEGVVVGKALLEKKFTLKELSQLC
jgi:phosphoribosylformimino-5-aminoimidazole carboxamide ribotide isomerase